MRGQRDEADKEADSGENAPAERRSSVEVLQSLLNKVSRSPYNSQYSTLVSSDTSGSTQNDSLNKQDGDLLADCSAGDVRSNDQPVSSENLKMETSLSSGVQDGLNGGMSRTNPFYAYYLESGYDSRQTAEVSLRSSGIIVPPPDYESSPADPQRESHNLENGSTEHQKDPSWTPTPVPRSRKAAPKRSTDETHRGLTLDKENLSLNTGDVQDFLPKEVDRATQSNSPNISANPFQSFLNNGNYSDQTTGQQARKSSMETRDEFSPFSSSDLFPSPITKNLFQDLSPVDDAHDKEPKMFQRSLRRSRFVRPPSSKLLKNGDIFDTPGKANPNADIFTATSSNSLSEAQLQVPDVPSGILLTSPNGTSHDVLQESPVVRPRNGSTSPSNSPADMEHVQTFKRPPRPLPRIRPSRPDKPPKPSMKEAVVPKTLPRPAFKPLLKPPVPIKQKTPKSKPVDPEDFVGFENILLIGQEHCVEDWPDDSPEVQPHFKPGGTLRLRRESLLMKTDSDGGSGEEQSSSHGKKKDKFRVSMLSRRGSKQDKFPEDNKSHTLPLPRRSSKDYFPDYSSEKQEDDEFGEADFKKTPLKTKMNKMLRRASTASSVFDVKRGSKTKVSTPDDSTGDEECCGRHDETESKRKKKMNIKFVPQRGFAISVDKDKKPLGAEGYTPRKDSFVDDDLKKPQHTSPYDFENEDKKPKRSTMKKLLQRRRRTSKDDMLDDYPKKSSFSAEELDEDQNRMYDYNAGDYEEEESVKGCRSPREVYEYEEDELGICKQKKSSKLKVFKKHKSKQNKRHEESFELPPGAPPGLSEAAQAEWMAAQVDERTLAGLEDEDADGDTDSLMEWWYKVEQWDEVPSDDENKTIQEDQSKSFSILADKVDRGLHVFNKVFTERAELLWQYIITLHAIADDISTFHQKARIANITGGTTTAVGGVTAIAGLALAPLTLGVSLVITAVGLGVATAGGIASASATISDNVNNMNDRKKVESLLLEYEENLQVVAKVLRFVNHGMCKLRGHPFLRSGTQHYSQDWEIRRAVQMISMADAPVMRATEVTDEALSTLQGLFQGMDKYFIKDTRELKKGCKKAVVAQIKEVANVLNDAVVELNGLREDLQDAFGTV